MDYCLDCGSTLAAGAAECFRRHARFGERPSADEVRREARRGALQGTLIAASIIVGVIIGGTVLVGILIELLVR
jgi:hypothetical protein